MYISFNYDVHVLAKDFDSNSVWKIVDIALASISQNVYDRPNMQQIVLGLKDWLQGEENYIEVKVLETERCWIFVGVNLLKAYSFCVAKAQTQWKTREFFFSFVMLSGIYCFFLGIFVLFI